MGFPVSALPILTIIATVIDVPATVLNIEGDIASSMLVGRLVDGKHFLKEKLIYDNCQIYRFVNFFVPNF